MTMNTTELIRNAAKNNPVYSLFDNAEVLKFLDGLEIEKSIWKDNIKSERSLRFSTKDSKQPYDLIKSFHLNPKSFPDKFSKAIEGDGQEHRRIRTLHSSSLISLLCFYNVSETNPLCISIDGHDIEFTESSFEERNWIGNDEDGKPHNSNMDVLLIGRNKITDKKAVLFLESKFSEYLSWGKHTGISNSVYWDTYDKLFRYLELMGLKYEPMKNNKQYSELVSIKGRTNHYASGIKQMISHFMGVSNVTKEYNNYDIYLGTILYRFPETVDPNNKKFNDYTGLYDILTEGLNSISESKFKVIGQCLTYQDVFKSYDLDSAVRAFYSLPIAED